MTQETEPTIPKTLNSYDKEAIRLIDHSMMILPMIRKRLIEGIDQLDVGISAQSFDEVLSKSNVPVDPTGEIAVDPRRGIRRTNIKRTRDKIKRFHKSLMSAFDSATEASF